MQQKERDKYHRGRAGKRRTRTQVAQGMSQAPLLEIAKLTRFTRRLALIALLWIMILSTVQAAPDSPPWRQNLTCDPAVQKYQGVEYCTGLSGREHVIIVDLQSSGVRLEYVIAQGVGRNGQFGECKDVNVPRWGPVRGGCADPNNRAYYPVMSLMEAVARYPKAAAVINSDYGAGTQDEPKSRGHGPEGFTVVRGDRLDGPANGDTDDNAVRRPWLAVSKNAPLQVELSQFVSGQDDGSKSAWIYTGVGGGPWLIRQGKIEEGQIRNCTNANPHSCQSSVAQTAVGLSEGRRWLYLVVVEGRDAFGTAQFLHDQLLVAEAIKFDGGGSSQLWYGGLPSGQQIVRDSSRQLSQYLAVIADRGSGIEDTADELPLSAQPARPVFFDVVVSDEVAHLHIEMRNTGTVAWDPAQGIELRRVWKDVISPVVESYPLSQLVSPGETASWDITVNAEGSRFMKRYFQLYQGDTPFGPEVMTVVITLPEQLESQKERFRRAIEKQLEEWQDEAEKEVERRWEDFRTWLLDLIQREIERQVQNLLDKICGANALLLGGLLLIALRRSRR